VLLGSIGFEVVAHWTGRLEAAAPSGLRDLTRFKNLKIRSKRTGANGRFGCQPLEQFVRPNDRIRTAPKGSEMTGMGAQPSELGGAERPQLRSPPGPAYARLGSNAARHSTRQNLRAKVLALAS
jgi:hypothetical protein